MNELIEKLALARITLATAKASLRLAEDTYATTKASIEANTIEEAGASKALGSNKEDRDRNLLLALNSVSYYCIALDDLRTAQAAHDGAQATLDCLLDQRRDQETRIRDRYVTLLEDAAPAEAFNDNSVMAAGS